MGGSWDELVAGVRAGRPRALARLISRVEDREPGWEGAMQALYPHARSVHVVGITGPPGAGKSSLTNRIAARLVERGHRVGIIAVDPTSPFSGGALLGDRLRMRDVATTPGVFIRSMATRGTLGGLCQGARDVVRMLAAAGHDIVVIETVGVGQDEIEIVKAADTVVVVCVPGQGDGVHTLKAGIMEIADVFVVNKADTDGAQTLIDDIRSMQALGADVDAQHAPVLATCAVTGRGVDELVDVVLAHAGRPDASEARAAVRVREEIVTLLERDVARMVRRRSAGSGALDDAVRRVRGGEIDPYSAARQLLERVVPEARDGDG